MTALDQLVRVHRWNLDEKRQKLAELERLRERLMGNIDVLEAELRHEQEVASRSAVTSIALPAFIRATQDRRRKIEESITGVDRSIAAARDEIMRDARRQVRELPESERLVAAVVAGDAHRDPRRVARMPVDALVREVQPVAAAVEQIPQPRHGKMALRVGEACVGRQLQRLASAPVLPGSRHARRTVDGRC